MTWRETVFGTDLKRLFLISCSPAILAPRRSTHPTDPIPKLILGQLASRQGQFETARHYLAAAASLAVPDDWPESHRHRFAILLESERFKVAQGLQDITLARDALGEWIKWDAENTKLKAMAEELRVDR